MSTLALEGSERVAGSARAGALARNADLVLLALALAVFVAADLPLVGYAVAAIVWIAQRVAQEIVRRRVARDLAAGARRSAMGLTAGSTLGRVWVVAAAVLAVGLISGREDGLAAAALCAVLFTVHFAAEAVAHVRGREGAR